MSPRLLSKLGVVGMAAGILGAASAVLMLLWPPQVPADLVSYPFSVAGFYVIQVWFFVHHLGLVAVLMALAGSGAVGRGRFVRGGAWLAVLGAALLAGAELLAMGYADWDNDAANAGLMGSAYGIACTVTGIGLVVAGAGTLRAHAWTTWRRWVPLLTGVAVFVMVTPAMFAGFVTARLGIGAWMLMFAALGWSVYAESRSSLVPAVGPDDSLGTLYGARPSSSVDRAAAS